MFKKRKDYYLKHVSMNFFISEQVHNNTSFTLMYKFLSEFLKLKNNLSLFDDFQTALFAFEYF